MLATHPASTQLFDNRNKAVAKSFFRQLRAEGFSHEQIIVLSATLLDLVTDDMKSSDRDEA
jgi:transposase-like protein